MLRKNKNSFVFFIGDDGAILTHVNGANVEKKVFLNFSNPDAISVAKDIIVKSPKTPIYVLLDSIDQNYQTQNFPPVSRFSVQKLVNQKLERDFAQGDITSSLPAGRDEEGRQDWKFLIVSVVQSPQLIQWLDFILDLDNPFTGLFLVPVEAENIIKKIAPKIEADGPDWQILVLHNKVSGFRQIITKDGRLVFTRLTQSTAGESSPLILAGNIEQELSNTIEYLKRLSYKDSDPLNISIVASGETVNAVDISKISNQATSALLTPETLSEKLGMDSSAYSDNHYADIVLSSHFNSTKKKILPLHTEQSKKIGTLEMVLSILKYGIIALCALSFIAMLYFGYAWYDKYQSVTPVKSTINQNQSKISTLKKQTDLLPEDIEKISDAVSIYESFAKQEHLPTDFITQMAKASDGSIIVKDINWNSSGTFKDRAEKKPENVQISVSVEVVKTTESAEQRIQMMSDYIERLNATFPEFKITHSEINATLYERGRLAIDYTNPVSKRLNIIPISFDLNFSTSVNEKGGNR